MFSCGPLRLHERFRQHGQGQKKYIIRFPSLCISAHRFTLPFAPATMLRITYRCFAHGCIFGIGIGCTEAEALEAVVI